MILVVLGTQDKQFKRLLEDIEEAIKSGAIKEKVIVQAGSTEYKSDHMEIFDLLPTPEFNKLMDKANLIITHGGVGTILTAIKKGKRIIATPRLSKYGEHHNDHQKQIIDEFKKLGYLLEYDDGDDLGELIKKSKKIKNKKFESNTNNMIKLIDNYIKDSDNTAWYHKYKEVILYLFFGGCTTLVNIISFMFLFKAFGINTYVSNVIAWILSVLFAFITNKIFVFESKNKEIKENVIELVSFVTCRIVSLLFDMLIMFVMIDIINCSELLSKIVSNIFVIIINYVFSKLIIFKDK